PRKRPDRGVRDIVGGQSEDEESRHAGGDLQYPREGGAVPEHDHAPLPAAVDPVLDHDDHEHPGNEHDHRGGDHHHRGSDHDHRGGDHDHRGSDHDYRGGDHDYRGGDHDHRGGDHDDR